VTALETAPLGRTGLVVGRVGFGAAPLGDFFARLDEATAIATVSAALEAGITLFDVAPHYGNGLAEHRVGTALRAVPRDRFVLSTKIGRVMEPAAAAGAPAAPPPRGFVGGLPHRPRFDYSYDGVMRSFEQSLLRLATDRIDILLIHDVDDWTHGPEGAEARYREVMDGGLRALDELRRAGVVRAVGLGLDDHVWCERFLRDGDFDVFLLAGRYSLLEQPGGETLLPLAAARGVGVILGGVFNSGILATGPVPGARYNYEPAPPDVLARVGRIAAVCADHGVALPHAALRFALAHPAVAAVVLGAVTPAEIARNLAAAAAPIPAALWADLRTAGLIAEDAPTP